jgi:hypothetical protein
MDSTNARPSGRHQRAGLPEPLRQASSIEEKLGEVSSRQCESGAGMEVYKVLAVETYRLLELLVDSMGLDHEEIDKGRKDALPTNLLYREKEIKSAYGNNT